MAEVKNLSVEAMAQTIDQLRQNAKSHKRTVDKLATKVSILTQENAQLRSKQQKTKWSTLCYAAIGSIMFGFLFALGALGAWGWLVMLKGIL